MKSYRSLALVAASLSAAFYAQGALAQDGPPIPLRILSDPLYLPLGGQIYGSTDYTYGDTTKDVYNAAGAQTEADRIHSNTITQEFAYGITDDLSVNASIGYAPNTTNRVTTAAGTTNHTSTGWTDPVFGVTYRAIDQSFSPVSVDLGASYSPNAFVNRTATATRDGTVARGGQAVDLFARAGHEWRRFTLAGTFKADYDDTSTEGNPASGAVSHLDSNWRYTAALDSQFRFTPLLSLNAGAGYHFGDNTGAVNDLSGLERDIHTGDYQDLNVALNYHFVPDVLVGSLEYQHNFYNNSRTAYPAAAANDTFTRNKDEDLIGVRLRYDTP